MKFETSFNQNIQPQFKAEIEGYLRKLEWLVPNWVQRIHVNLWNGENSEEMIAVKVYYEYRDVCLDFYAGWLNQSDADKLRQVVHEVLHIHLGLIADYARDKFELLCPKDEATRFNKSLQDELRQRHESATQDLAHAIVQKLSQ